MKYLVVTSMRPGMSKTLEQVQTLEATISSMLKSGQFDCLYQRVVAGGAVGIVNVSTAEELWEMVATFPQTEQYEWQVEPLADLDYVFNKVHEWFNVASA